MLRASRLTVISVGYQGKTQQELVAALQTADVELVVDVRLNPISRKSGLSKSALASALNGAGIEYQSVRALGNPKSNRQGFSSKKRSEREQAKARYLKHLTETAWDAYKSVEQIILARRTALLCFEEHHDTCHRACIIGQITSDHPACEIQRL